MAEKEDFVGKCPYCEKDLTWKDIQKFSVRPFFGLAVFTCPYCKKIISIDR